MVTAPHHLSRYPGDKPCLFYPLSPHSVTATIYLYGGKSRPHYDQSQGSLKKPPVAGRCNVLQPECVAVCCNLYLCRWGRGIDKGMCSTTDLATWNPTCCSPSLHKCGIRFGRAPYVNTGKIAHNSSFPQKAGSLDNLHEAPCALSGSVRGSLSVEEIERGWAGVKRKNFWAPCRLSSFFSLLSHRLFPHLWSLNFLTMFWSRHLGSLTAANWVSFDFNVSYSSCWGYSLINTLKLKKIKTDRRDFVRASQIFHNTCHSLKNLILMVLRTIFIVSYHP